MVTIARQSTRTPPAFNMDPEGRRATFDKVYLGFVQDTEDVANMGRIKVWVPELCGPNNSETWIICDYCAPFGGSSGGGTNTGSTSYGMWFTPKKDANVLVTFINGDPNRGVYLGCMFPVDQHRQTPSGRTNGDGTPQNNTNNIIGSSQISSPVSAADIASVNGTVGTSTTPPPSAPSSAAPQAAIVNAAATNSPGIRNLPYSSDNSYDVFGIRTPAGNSITMSDQEGAGEIRIQTFNMMQLIMNAQTGAIVIMNGDGSARVEIKRDGSVDIFGKGNVSIAAEKDLNLVGGQNVNIDANATLNMRGKNGLRAMSDGNISVYSGQNMFLTSQGEHHRYSNSSIFDTSSNKINRFANYSINDQVVSGDINFLAKGNVRAFANDGNIDLRAINTINIQSEDSLNILSKNDFKIMSQSGTGNMRSGNALRITSDDKVEISAVNGVYTDFQTYIDTGASTPASMATEAAYAGASIWAQTAERITVREFLRPERIPGSSSGAGGLASGDGRRYNVTTSIASRVPTSEPDVERYVASPGYSNTNTIERDEQAGIGYKLGQIDPNQPVPLQVMGYISGSYQIVPPNNLGLNENIMEAVRGMRAKYPNAVLGSTVRSGDAGQHGFRNAVDFTLDRLSESERSALVNEIARDIESGTGYFRYVRGVGMYDTQGRLLHMDTRPQNQSGIRNGMDVWGQNRSITGVASSTPIWFQQAMKISGNTIGLKPAIAQPATPVPSTPSTPVDPNSQPMRYVGIGYNNDGTPRYNQEPVSNGTFKLASEFAGPLNGLSEIGLQDIANFETLRGPWPMDIPNKKFFHACAPRPSRVDQQPTNGIAMIGYGHKLTDAEISSNKITIKGTEVDISNSISDSQALDLLKQDLEPFVSNIKSKITPAITQQQFDSLVDFSWNIGLEKFNGSECKVITLINEKKYDQVPGEMIKWRRACGGAKDELLTRRQANSRRFCGIMRPDSPALITSRSSGTPSRTVSGDSSRIAFCFFMGKFDNNMAWAAGFVGNFITESQLNPSIVSPDGRYVGIAQWGDSRRGKFISVREVNPRGVTLEQATLQEQLNYVWWELNNGSGPERHTIQKLRSSISNADAEGAAEVINMWYEGSSSGIAQREGRSLTAAQSTSSASRRTNARAVYARFSTLENPCVA